MLMPNVGGTGQGSLLGQALEALASPGERTAGAAADALVTLLGPGLEEEGDRATLLLAIHALTQQGQRAFESPEQTPSWLLHGLTRVATAIAERDPSVAASPQVWPGPFPLVSLPFTCPGSVHPAPFRDHGGRRYCRQGVMGCPAGRIVLCAARQLSCGGCCMTPLRRDGMVGVPGLCGRGHPDLCGSVFVLGRPWEFASLCAWLHLLGTRRF